MTTLGEKIREKREALKMSQADLGRLVGVSQATIDKIESGTTKQSKFLVQVARALKLPFEDVFTFDVVAAPDPPPNPFGPNDFPVYASTEGGPEGEIIRSVEPVDWVPRPAPVMHVKEAYGMLVSGTSMFPEFRPGDTAHVNPKLPVVNGEVYVFYRELHGEARSMIKQLSKHTADKWHVHQWNPPEGQKHDFTLDRGDWRWAHRVFGKQGRI